MTNEEAIKKLKSFCHNCSKYPQCVNTDRECFEALDMAIQSLEQTDGDLIPRQSVITMLNKIESAVEDGDGFQFNEWIDYANSVLEDIKAELAEYRNNFVIAKRIDLASAVDNFEEKQTDTAEWIDLGDVIQCPNCETLYPKVRVDLKHYCERCGSKMKGH